MHSCIQSIYIEALSLNSNGGDTDEANHVRNPTTIHITRAQEVQDYRHWKHRDIIPLEEPLILVITPTYNNETKPFDNGTSAKKKRKTPQEQLADLTTSSPTLLLDGNILLDCGGRYHNPAIR